MYLKPIIFPYIFSFICSQHMSLSILSKNTNTQFEYLFSILEENTKSTEELRPTIIGNGDSIKGINDSGKV